MKTKAPTEDQIIDLLRQIRPFPDPRFNKKMANQPWNRNRRLKSLVRLTPKRATMTFAIILLLIIGIGLFSPSINSIAQRLTQYFLPTSSNFANKAIAPLETIHPVERFHLTIAEAETMAGFKMKALTTIPQEFHLIGSTYDELREAIILHFATNTGGLVLRFSQQKVDQDYQGIGPEAVVEIVSVGPNSGEYVAGGWKIPEVESGIGDTHSPYIAQTVWDTNVNLQTLRWSDGEFLYEIILAGGWDQPGYLDQDGLIALADRIH